MPRKKPVIADAAPPAPRRKMRGARFPDRRYVTFDIRPDGSPTPYMLTDAGLAKVRQMSADGCTLGTIADQLGVEAGTFSDIRKRQPASQEAVDVGRAALGTELTDILMTHARKGNVVAAIFLAKSRAGFVESTGQVEGASVTNNTQINISIPAPLPADEVVKIIGTLPAPESER